MRSFALISLAFLAGGCFSEPLEAAPPNTGSSSSGGPSESTSSEPGTTEAVDVSSTGDAGSTGTSEGETGSTGGSSSTGGEAGSTSDPPRSTCGDGIIEGAEVCDDEGPVVLEPGACRPDCSGPIPLRRITLSPQPVQGDLGPDPVATVDSLCPAGARAMFSDGVARRASVAPNAVVDPIDWVLHPFTAYQNAAGEVLWVTDMVPLLGSRDGLPTPLLHSIVPFDRNPPGVLTGMNSDWTSPPQADCEGWTSASANAVHSAGIPWILDGGGYLDNGGVTACNVFGRVYCVEQD
ncbi:MAG: DUF1554 domain-containing protein [Myxococcota bacterium]